MSRQSNESRFFIVRSDSYRKREEEDRLLFELLREEQKLKNRVWWRRDSNDSGNVKSFVGSLLPRLFTSPPSLALPSFFYLTSKGKNPVTANSKELVPLDDS